MEKRKIIFFSQSCIPERIGGATHNFEMAKKLSELGHRIDFITAQPSYPFGEFNKVKEKKKEWINENLCIIRLPSYRPKKGNPSFLKRYLYFSMFSINASLYALFKSFRSKYDLVITSIPNEPTLLPGLICNKIFGKKWIIDIRDLWIENAVELGLIGEEDLITKLFKKFRNYSFKNADGITFTAHMIINELEKNGYVIPEKRLFNPNGYDPDSYPIKKNRTSNILYLGNVGFAYELEVVIDAIRFSKFKNWKLIIRGGGDSLQDVKEKVDRLNLLNRVEFISPLERSKLLDLISKSRIGVCPLKNKKSLASVIPTKIIEYLGCGIPFVTSGQGEVERIANESNAGIYVKADPGEYAKAIDELLENKELYKKMSSNAINYVDMFFNKKNIIRNLDRFLETV